jgi:hypothetical protein
VAELARKCDARTMCPRTMCPQTKSLNVPRILRPLDMSSLTNVS